MDRSDEFNHHRARVAALSRGREPNDPDLAAARISMWAVSDTPDRLAELVTAVRAVRDGLNPAERKRIAAVLRGGRDDPR